MCVCVCTVCLYVCVLLNMLSGIFATFCTKDFAKRKAPKPPGGRGAAAGGPEASAGGRPPCLRLKAAQFTA